MGNRKIVKALVVKSGIRAGATKLSTNHSRVSLS
jgi:hypothetical protein